MKKKLQPVIILLFFSFYAKEYRASNPEKALYPHFSAHTIGPALNNLRIMSTNILAFIFHTCPNQALSTETLEEKFDCIWDDLAKSRTDVGFSGQTSDVVEYAVSY